MVNQAWLMKTCRTPVGVEIVVLTKFAKIKLRQEALQSIFSGRLDIFYPPNFGSLRRKASFNSHGCFQQLSRRLG
jgi:hypothetical protein